MEADNSNGGGGGGGPSVCNRPRDQPGICLSLRGIRRRVRSRARSSLQRPRSSFHPHAQVYTIKLTTHTHVHTHTSKQANKHVLTVKLLPREAGTAPRRKVTRKRNVTDDSERKNLKKSKTEVKPKEEKSSKN